MRKDYFSVLISSCCLLLASCVSVTPVLNSFEKAGTLGRGNGEVVASYTGYNETAYDRSAHSHNSYGFRAGYGLTDRFDLKVRYEHLKPVRQQGQTELLTNYYSLIPKVALVPGLLSLSLPLSHYSYQELVEGKALTRKVNSIATQLHYTYTVPSRKVDLTGGLKADFVYGQRGYEAEHDLLLSTSIGAGFSNNVDRWAVRPEVGFVASTGKSATYITYGVGVQYTLFGKKARGR